MDCSLRPRRPWRLHGLAARLHWLLLGAAALAWLPAMTVAAAPRPAARGTAKKATGKADPTAQVREQVKNALAQGNYAAARQALDAAFRRAPVPELLLLLARLAVAEGRSLDAYDLMRRYLADPARPSDETADREAQLVLAQTPPPSSEVRVLGDAGAVVEVDDRTVGVLPLTSPLLLSVGPHTMALSYPEKKLDSPILVQQGRVTEVRSNRVSGAMLLSQLPTILVILDAPGLAEGPRREFWALAEEAAADEQVTVLRPEVALTAAPELKGCLAQVKCWRQLAALNKTDLVLGVHLPSPPPPPLAPASPAPASAAGPASSPAPAATTAPTAAAAPPTSPAALPAAPPTAPATGPEPAGSSSAAPPSPALGPATVGNGGPGTGSPSAAASPRGPLSLKLLHQGIEEPAAPPVSLDIEAGQALPAGLRPILAKLFSVGLNRQHGLVTIASDPRGASVEIGELGIGRTPIEREMWAGSYTLSASRPGYRSERRPLEVRGGQPERVEFDLAPLSFDRPEPRYIWQRQARPRYRLILGGASIAAGAVLLGFGSSGLALDGSCSAADRIPATGECRFVYQTAAPGAALVVVGGVVVAAGAVLLALPGERRRVLVPDEPTASPAPASAPSP